MLLQETSLLLSRSRRKAETSFTIDTPASSARCATVAFVVSITTTLIAPRFVCRIRHGCRLSTAAKSCSLMKLRCGWKCEILCLGIALVNVFW